MQKQKNYQLRPGPKYKPKKHIGSPQESSDDGEQLAALASKPNQPGVAQLPPKRKTQQQSTVPKLLPSQINFARQVSGGGAGSDAAASTSATSYATSSTSFPISSIGKTPSMNKAKSHGVAAGRHLVGRNLGKTPSRVLPQKVVGSQMGKVDLPINVRLPGQRRLTKNEAPRATKQPLGGIPLGGGPSYIPSQSKKDHSLASPTSQAKEETKIETEAQKATRVRQEVIASLEPDWQAQIAAGKKALRAIREGDFGDFISNVRKIAEIGSLRAGNCRDSILHILARSSKSIEQLKWLFKEFPYLDLTMTNRFDETMLHAAVLANNSAVLRLCLTHKVWQERRSKMLQQLDCRGRSPLALALTLGHGHCIFEILRFDADCCLLPERNQLLSFSHRVDRYREDDSWSLEPSFAPSEEADYAIPLESSFILALKHNRFRALDHIFTKHQRQCMTELVKLVKTDAVLSRKWDMYLGLDLYMPTLLVWLLMREKARPDVKRRFTKLVGFTKLPLFQFKEVLKYV